MEGRKNVQEELNQSGSNTDSWSGSFKYSRGVKRQKVPQRGLGVAQLEKIRIEEQQKKVAGYTRSLLSANSDNFPPTPTYKINGNTPISSIPLQAPSASDLTLLSSAFRPPTLVPNLETAPSIPVAGYPNFPVLWNPSGYNLERENLPYELNPIFPVPQLMQRTQLYQQPSSLANSSSRPATSSSVLNIQMEPPSNQSYYSNYTARLPQEEQMVGMKRQLPFLVEDPVAPPFHCKYHPGVAPRSPDESLLSGDGNSFTRQPHLKKATKGMGDFLTLGLPSNTSTSVASHSRELSESNSTPYQGSTEDQTILLGQGDGSGQGQPLYNFFLLPPSPPKAESTLKESTDAATNEKKYVLEVRDDVDLDLNL